MRAKTSIFYLLLVTSLSSCFYYSELIDVPLINEKNDLRVDAGFSPASANAAVSYGLTDHIAIGYGNGNYSDNTGPGTLFGSYQRTYGQLNFGKLRSENSFIECAVSLKSGLLTADLTSDGYFYDIGGIEPETVIDFQDRNLFVEPQVMVRLGRKQGRLNLKCGYNYIYKYSDEDLRVPTAQYNLGLSYSYDF